MTIKKMKLIIGAAGVGLFAAMAFVLFYLNDVQKVGDFVLSLIAIFLIIISFFLLRWLYKELGKLA